MPTPTATPAPAADSGDPHPHLTALRREGYTIIRSALSDGAELSALRDAAARLTAAARAGGWPHVRTVGKQFPPWDPADAATAGIWGVQHLLHPDLPVSDADRAAFARLYFSPVLLGVVRELLSLPPADDDDGEEGEGEQVGGGGGGGGGGGKAGLVMELLNLLVRPDGEDGFALRWHRDDIPASATPEEEVSRLGLDPDSKHNKVQLHAQWNLPLLDDDSLIVVPGSHARARTPLEREADPYAPELPGMVRVKLAPGDVVFYDNNILHRGVYEPGKERLTLHGSVGHAGGSRERARNVLQHGVGEWVDRCDFSCLGEGPERRRAERMRRRLVELGRENQGRDVGYSLDG